mmetsp:Transcript_2393/g.5515  ORF Transcript_2393/g.5515 Transcript_2393/m.5515 type:complete len:102 (-) Transcript_2393:160-465(-)
MRGGMAPGRQVPARELQGASQNYRIARMDPPTHQTLPNLQGAHSKRPRMLAYELHALQCVVLLALQRLPAQWLVCRRSAVPLRVGDDGADIHGHWHCYGGW